MSLQIRRFVLLTLAVVVLSLALVGPAARADDDDEYVPGEVQIKLVQGNDLRAVALEHGLDPEPLDQFGSRAIYRLKIVDGAKAPQRAQELRQDTRVVYAEPNYLWETPESRQRSSWAIGGDAGTYRAQWAPQVMRLPEAHTVTTGAGIVVAVLDTGVDRRHPALSGRLVAGYDFVDADRDPSEEGRAETDLAFGHGTHVAGLVALAAPGAKIMPIRVLDPDGIGNLWVLAEALEYAVNPDGDRTTADGADVVNLSFSTQRKSELIRDLFEDLECDEDDSDDRIVQDDDDVECLDPGSNGVVVVAAAGNSGGTTPEYPAAEGAPVLLAVGASTMNDTLATFSTRGSWVDVLAPGEQILSSVPGGGYGTWSGTSMAAPLAAGTAALVRAHYPRLNAQAVVEHIRSRSAHIDGPVQRRVDAAAAVGLRRGDTYRIELPLLMR